MRRFLYAQEKYKVRNNPGWRTDMGRIYIMYGEPSNVVPHPLDPGMKPWEQWIYDDIKGQGQVEFIFGDIAGYNNYELLHTNLTVGIRTEIYNPYWRERLIR